MRIRNPARRTASTPAELRAQHILMHLAAIEMKERHRRIVAQRPGRETVFEFGQDIFGHGMQVRERLRSDLYPDQLHQFSIGMDHSFDAMSDAGCVSRKKPSIEAPYAARRCDRAGDQKQPGW